VRAVVQGTPLANAPMVGVSSTTGAGLDALRAALTAVAGTIPPRDEDDLFRLPVDRAFTVKGTGTVVTGTVWSGTVARDAAVRVIPGEHAGRVRGAQAHGAGIDHPAPGTRTALALVGVAVDDVPRGSVLVSHPAWRPTGVLRADVALLAEGGRTIGPRTRVRLHLGTAEVGARMIAAGGPLSSGDHRPVRLVLDAPIVARAGDPFVLRAASPAVTIGGGVVTDPYPRDRRTKPFPSCDAAATVRMGWLLADAALEGIPVADLPVRLGAPPRAIAALVDAAGGRVAGARVVANASIDRAVDQLATIVRSGVAAAPLEAGMALQAARGGLRGAADVLDDVVRVAVAR
jgi:selenocysteine-specific elongation factor